MKLQEYRNKKGLIYKIEITIKLSTLCVIIFFAFLFGALMFH